MLKAAHIDVTSILTCIHPDIHTLSPLLLQQPFTRLNNSGFANHRYELDASSRTKYKKVTKNLFVLQVSNDLYLVKIGLQNTYYNWLSRMQGKHVLRHTKDKGTYDKFSRTIGQKERLLLLIWFFDPCVTLHIVLFNSYIKVLLASRAPINIIRRTSREN